MPGQIHFDLRAGSADRDDHKAAVIDGHARCAPFAGLFHSAGGFAGTGDLHARRQGDLRAISRQHEQSLAGGTGRPAAA